MYRSDLTKLQVFQVHVINVQLKFYKYTFWLNVAIFGVVIFTNFMEQNPSWEA
jgi:hypothetical protein